MLFTPGTDNTECKTATNPLDVFISSRGNYLNGQYTTAHKRVKTTITTETTKTTRWQTKKQNSEKLIII